MERALEVVSDFLPMTYAYDALERVSARSEPDGGLLLDAAVLIVATGLALAFGAPSGAERSSHVAGRKG